MAKKKLTPYQQARRDFVQARVQARGIEGTPEERKQIRQRFDVLAQTKEGRGKIARNVLPTEGPEERKNFKRLLSTELPARDITTPKTVTTTTPKTGTTYSQAQIAQMRSVASSMGPQLYQIQKPAASTQSKTVSPSAKSTQKTSWKQNSVVQNIRTGLINVVPGLSNVAKARTEMDKGNIAGTFKQLALGVPQTAAFVASVVTSGRPTPKALGTGPLGIGTGMKPKLPTPPTPRTGGPRRPTPPNRGPKALGPGPAVTPKTSTTPKTSVTPKTTAKKTNAKSNPAVSKILKDADKAATKPAATKPAATKPAATKPATTRPASTKGPRISRQDADDVAYSLTQAKNRFPGFREGDAAFVAKLNRAQETIEKNAPGAAQYAKWLKNPQTQATLRRLRKK